MREELTSVCIDDYTKICLGYKLDEELALLHEYGNWHKCCDVSLKKRIWDILLYYINLCPETKPEYLMRAYMNGHGVDIRKFNFAHLKYFVILKDDVDLYKKYHRFYKKTL